VHPYLPLDILQQATQAAGTEISKENMMRYLDGNKVAAESTSDDPGQTTMVSGTNTNTMDHILRSQKEIVVVHPEDLNEAASAASKSQ